MGRKSKTKDEKTAKITISLSREAEAILIKSGVNRSKVISQLIVQNAANL